MRRMNPGDLAAGWGKTHQAFRRQRIRGHYSTVSERVNDGKRFVRRVEASMRRRLWIGAFVFVGLLAFPRTGSAGIGEIILELSGPTMVGGGLECKFFITGHLDQCYVAGFRRKGKPPASIADSRIRLSLETAAYVSTGNNNGDVDYEFGKIWMLAFDPMVEFISFDCGALSTYHGVMGLTYNLFLGPDFDKFSNVGFKLRPIGVRVRRVNFEYNIRIYPNRFTPDQFGKVDPSPIANTKSEAVHSFSIGIAIGD
jgi:hypothetical protein